MPTLPPNRIFRDLARLHVRAQRAEIACRDTSETHCTILTELGRAETMPMSELVARLRLDKGWVSRAVDQLVQEGLAHRTSNETDRRSILISLTAAGRKQFRALEATLNAQLERVFARLTPGERAGVAGALELLYAAYTEEAAARTPKASARHATAGV